MAKNDICLWRANKQNVFFFKKCAPKNVPMLSMFRIDPALLSRYAKANDK